MDTLAQAALIGSGATVVMDAWGIARRRLLVSALEHEDNPAGRWLLAELSRHLLRTGFEAPGLPAPRFAETMMLDGPWTLGTTSKVVTTGTPRRTKGANVFEGWETFTAKVAVPAAWAGRPVLLRAEAVGDAYEVILDGERLLLAGDEHGVLAGMRDIPKTFDVTGRFRPGETHDVTFRVRDWRGGGGLVGPVYLTTSDPTARWIY